MDKQEMIRRTKYDRLRKSYGTDRVIEKEVYLAYYNKLLTRIRSYAKRKLKALNDLDREEAIWKFVLNTLNVLKESALTKYDKGIGILARKNIIKDKKFDYADIKQIYLLDCVERFCKDENRLLHLDADFCVLDRYVQYCNYSPSVYRYIDVVLETQKQED